MSVLNKLGIKRIKEFNNQDEWYKYLINQYIPTQGKEDMNKFIDLKFDVIKYIIWKAKKKGLFSKELEKEINKQI